jgi:hypothetical protein
MMVFNHRVRARYFWHVAEWMRTHPGLGGTDLQVVHGTETYELPHYQHQATRPTRNYTYWPVRARLRHAPAAPVLYDSYLYLLGADAYRTSVLPGLAGGGGDVDSLLMVIVKARFRFSGWIDTETHRRSALTRINQRAHAALNNRCFAAFTVAANPQSPPALARCLLHVSVRFRVGSAANEHLSVEIGAGSDADWEPGDDPRSLVIGVADALPGTAAGVSTQMGNVADAFFTRLCSLLGLSADAAPANSFTKADAYKGIVRSVAGTSVNPTMSRT